MERPSRLSPATILEPHSLSKSKLVEAPFWVPSFAQLGVGTCPLGLQLRCLLLPGGNKASRLCVAKGPKPQTTCTKSPVCLSGEHSKDAI